MNDQIFSSSAGSTGNPLTGDTSQVNNQSEEKNSMNLDLITDSKSDIKSNNTNSSGGHIGSTGANNKGSSGGQSDGSNANFNLRIPDEVKEKFPQLVEQIIASKSMDDDERNYWFSVLPIMTQTQIAELKDILDSEKRKLDEINKKYAEKDNSSNDLQKSEEERMKIREKRLEEEKKHQEEVEKNAEDMLSALDDL